MPAQLPNGVTLVATDTPKDTARVLTRDALDFVAALVREFRDERTALLQRRRERQQALDAGEVPDFPASTAPIREAAWQVAPAPPDLEDRRVEITGPTDAKLMINALNSGARVFMADFEDSLAPSWENVVSGQANCMDAVRRTLTYRAPDGRVYALAKELATLLVRPRGWHLIERHLLVDGTPAPASLVDAAFYLFHNAKELMARGSGPYFYLPKLESHLEARLWNNVLVETQRMLGIPRGTVRVTVLIESILAAFEMDEILYELREHASGLNAGRWDYLFSIIKKFRAHPRYLLPDRAQLTMAVPFMQVYAQLLVHTCHRRNAHAIGGMSAFIPNRRDVEANARALSRVREDKEREAAHGFDGAWVAHPDLVPVVKEVFDAAMGKAPHQKSRYPTGPIPTRKQLLDVTVDGARVTLGGITANASVALRYMSAWLEGSGAVALDNLMEDAATAEIARAQLWQWARHGARLEDGRPVSVAMLEQVIDDVFQGLLKADPHPRLPEARALLVRLVQVNEFTEFFTSEAYPALP